MSFAEQLPDDETPTQHVHPIRDSDEPYVTALARPSGLPLSAWLPPATVTDDWPTTAWNWNPA
jgi:hypothetical protein